jgi:MOSC domain-containing protein YiiM
VTIDQTPDAPLSGPFGDPARHLTKEELGPRLEALLATQAPVDVGRVALMVARDGTDERLTPTRCTLTREGGIPGDKWLRKHPINPEAQLTVMRSDVAELLANGQALTLFGDNLFVTLELAASNLPVGTTLRVGGATLEVTSKPHNGCKKFKARFGLPALEAVADRATRPRNLRGIYMRVVEDGEVAVGDEIRVLRRS